jgi:hypothetical protein
METEMASVVMRTLCLSADALSAEALLSIQKAVQNATVADLQNADEKKWEKA